MTLLCGFAINLYRHWSLLLDQKRPKANTREIAEAKKAYISHRKNCKVCQPYKEKVEVGE